MQEILFESKNQTLKRFLVFNILFETSEDEKNSVYFEFKEWAKTNFSGIPSVEVQRLVDKNIPLWFANFDNIDSLLEKLNVFHFEKLGINASAISARYVTENYWKNKEDKRLIKAVELVEAWLKNNNSVTREELLQATNKVYSAGNFGHSTCGESSTAWVAYSTATTVLMVAKYQKSKPVEFNEKEICKVVAEKLPYFCYEDLLEWGYFSK
jgi:hypothetical protein